MCDENYFAKSAKRDQKTITCVMSFLYEHADSSESPSSRVKSPALMSWCLRLSSMAYVTYSNSLQISLC